MKTVIHCDRISLFNMMFDKKTDVDGCVRLMDEYRVKEAEAQAAE